MKSNLKNDTNISSTMDELEATIGMNHHDLEDSNEDAAPNCWISGRNIAPKMKPIDDEEKGIRAIEIYNIVSLCPENRDFVPNSGKL